MPRARPKTTAPKELSPEKRTVVLDRLLASHPDLREEAEAIASDMLQVVDPSPVADEVVEAFQRMDFQLIGTRAGRQPAGR